MISKPFWMIVMLLALVTLVVAQPPQGPGGSRPDGPGGPRGPEQFARLLGLTDAQKAHISALHEQSETAARPLHEQLEPLHEQLATLTHAAAFDAAAARALLNKTSQLEAELQFIHVRTENAIFNVYTPEQKAKLAELHQMRETRGPRGPRPNGRP